jgi:16S rRNA (guanine966-N2)-methyltransferase
MRIIAGKYKGRRLKTPTWEGLRPTSDKLRGTLFNILTPRIDGMRVLDGYAGTGALGIEALSRGASHVTFIDQNRRAMALIVENLRACGVEADYTIECGDVASVLRRASRDTTYDVVLLDPPYDLLNVTEALDAAAAHLAVDGVIVLERATRREPGAPASLTRVRDVKSGDSTLTFYRISDL